MRGSVDFRPGRWRLDTKQNVGSLISNEIILVELRDFWKRIVPGPRQARFWTSAQARYRMRRLRSILRHFDCGRCSAALNDTSSVDVFASADDLPFGAEPFSCVVCTEVLEHRRQPGAVMAEIARVLKFGGSTFLTTPFLLPLHDMPFDYYHCKYGEWLSAAGCHGAFSTAVPATSSWQSIPRTLFRTA